MIPFCEPTVQGFVGEGSKCREFEAAIAKTVGASYCSVVPNGTVGLMLALYALKVGPGDEVLVPAFSFPATAQAVTAVGATPRFVDVDDTMGMDPKKMVLGQAKAVIYASLNGRGDNIQEIAFNCRCFGTPLIEDACQSFAATAGGRSLGTWGVAGVYSFSTPKLITTGQGGAVVTNDPGFSDRLVRLRNFGRTGPEEYRGFGINAKFTDPQAILGLQQLDTLRVRQARKRSIYQFYQANGVPLIGHHGDPLWADMIVTRRNHFIQRLAEEGIEVRPFYPNLARLYGEQKFDKADYFAQHGVWLPSSTHIRYDQLEKVCQAVKRWF